MKYLKFFKREKNPFNQEEIDEIEDILLTYFDKNYDHKFERHPFYRINSIEDRKENMVNLYYISTEHPFHDPKKNLYRILIGIYSPLTEMVEDILNKFRKRIESTFRYNVKIKDDLNAYNITYKGYYGVKKKYLESNYKLKEYHIYITK